MVRGHLVADFALTLIGSPFRLHGREPRTGLDCVGLVLCALRSVGVDAREPHSYGLRNLSIHRQLKSIEAMGLEATSGRSMAGDILLFNVGPAQHHLAIAARQEGIIHAHLGFGRVVLTPRFNHWTVEQHWRLIDK